MTDLQHLKKLLTLYGRNVHSFQVLEPGLEVWFSSDGEGAVAYLDAGGYRVALGAPLGPDARRLDLSLEFDREARREGRKAVFFGVSERYWQALSESGFDALKVAEQPLWSPAHWQRRLSRNRRLRNRIGRCAREGVTIELQRAEQLGKNELETLCQNWQEGHKLPPMQFMTRLEILGHADDRFYVTARKQQRLVGIAVGVPIYGLDGWLLEDLVTERGAAHGLGEALIHGFMQEAARREARVVSLGMVILQGLDCPENRSHPLLRELMKLCKRWFRSLYNADGLRRFRDKLQPSYWESVYLVSPRGVDLLTLRAVLMAFAGGRLPTFAWRTLQRVTCPHGRSASHGPPAKPEA